MESLQDTICAPASGNGGAVAIIRISGGHALDAVDAVVCFRNGCASESRGGRVKFGTVSSGAGEMLDEVLVSVFRAPHSYTGEESAEIYCHASPYIISTLLDMLCAAGARMAMPGEFTQRAFLNGKMDLAQAEAVSDLIAASSRAAHRVAVNQLKGGYSRKLGELRSQLVELSALLELELDFSEEEVEFASREKLSGLLDSCISEVSALSDSFRVGNAVRNGVPVAIVGAPNSGKSTLLNRLVGCDRAIVSPVAGTTRDTVEECFNVDGVTFRFIDTAGIRETDDMIEGMGVQRSLDAVRRSSLVLWVVDAGAGANAGTFDGVLQLEDWQKMIVVLNKCDLAGNGCLADGIDRGHTGGYDRGSTTGFDRGGNTGFDRGGTTVRISALTGEGMDRLLDEIGAYGRTLVGGASDASSTLVTNARHAAALRESLAALTAVRSGLASGIPTDLVAEDLRSALTHLGSITGEISSNEVLGEIFGRFCIGK